MTWELQRNSETCLCRTPVVGKTVLREGPAGPAQVQTEKVIFRMQLPVVRQLQFSLSHFKLEQNE